MRRLVALAVIMFAAALGGPARADVLIGMAGPMTGKNAWFGEQLQRAAGWPWPTSTPPAACSASRCGSSRRTTSAIPSRRSPPPGSWSVTV